MTDCSHPKRSRGFHWEVGVGYRRLFQRCIKCASVLSVTEFDQHDNIIYSGKRPSDRRTRRQLQHQSTNEQHV